MALNQLLFNTIKKQFERTNGTVTSSNNRATEKTNDNYQIERMTIHTITLIVKGTRKLTPLIRDE